MDSFDRAQADKRYDRWRRLWPFAGVTALAVALAWLPPDRPQSASLTAVAALLAALVVVAIVLVPWPRLPSLAPMLPVVGFCVAVDLLRAASGGSSAGYGPLLLLPVIWQGLYGRQRNLYLSIVAVVVANVTAVVVLPGTVSMATQSRSIILYSVVAIVMGESIRRLVAERSSLLEQVTNLALYDQLTGLPNRRMWDDRLPVVVSSAARTGAPLTVALIDLDFFKAYNDRHGHVNGDRLLHSIAHAWRRIIRPDDLLVRWGGEEFALLLPATDDRAAVEVLARLQLAMPNGQTFSAGYSTEYFRPDAAPDLDRLVEGADLALYSAKDRGRAVAISAQALARDVDSILGLDDQPTARSTRH